MKLSVIVTTYNRPDTLGAVLQALSVQTGVHAADWQVLVADDGSGPATAACVTHWQAQFPCELKHVWHADEGFRAGAIRNLAALQSNGDYLVFMDGDCVPFADFVQQHSKLAEAGWMVAGNRVLFSAAYTTALLQSANPIAPIHWDAVQWLAARLAGNANRAAPWLRLPLRNSRKRRPKRWELVKTCNLGVWRNDFFNVDGFDETFAGWGHEDSDLAIRMLRAGCQIKDGRFAVPVLHLWHKENDRSQQPENLRRLQATLESKHTQAHQGLKK